MSTQENKSQPQLTALNGRPISDPYSTTRIGKLGPQLLQDSYHLESVQAFNRERIPDRIVHAKGGGAWGEFECTADLSDYTCASFLQKGKKCKTIARFSTVALEAGSPDTNRDPRGFSMRFYTDEGNCDWVFNNTPVFFIRDPIKFNYFIHSQKRNPQTNLRDIDAFWDYLSHNRESLHQVMTLFSDRGTPRSWREMHGYSGHTFKWVKEDGSFVYVQIHIKSDLGFQVLTNDEAAKVAGENPDANQTDLVNAIKKGNYPTWTCYAQIMTPEQAEKETRFSIFDLTKVWPQGDYPLKEFGKFTLNRVPDNFFAEIEQAAFCPSNTVPGWEPSADPVLQSRLFSYGDAHRYRLGTNFHHIPVNSCPFSHQPYVRNGSMCVTDNYKGQLNYPNSFEGRKVSTKADISGKHEQWVGKATDFHWTVEEDWEYDQARGMWKVFSEQDKKNFVYNVAGHAKAASEPVRENVYDYFSCITPQLGKDIKAKVNELLGSS